MLSAALAAAALLAAPHPGVAIPPHESLVLASWGRVVVRIDSDGYVQARGCDGRLRHVGDLPAPTQGLRIGSEGEVAGLVYDARLTPNQRTEFRRIMRAVGLSDLTALETACLPTETQVAGGPGAR